MGLRVIRATELQWIAQLSVMAVALLTTPRIIRGLGTDGYALYVLIWTLLNYLTILTLGTGTAVQRCAAQYYSIDEKKGVLGVLLRRTLAFQLLTGTLGAALLLAGRGWIAHRVLQAHGEALADTPRVFACVAIAAPSYFIAQFSLNVLLGMQRFATYNILWTLQALAMPIGTLILLRLGFGMREIAAFFAASSMLISVAALWPIRATLTASRTAGGRAEAKEFLSFSSKNSLSSVLSIVSSQGDRFFIGALLPLSQLSYYSVASGLAQKFNVFSASIASTAFPILTELHGKNEEARLRRVYLKTTELSLFIILPVSILSFILIPQFLTLWLGGDFSIVSTWPFRLLLLANTAYVATYMPNSLALTKGASHLGGLINGARVLILIAVWPFFIPRWGITGAALGVCAAEYLVDPPFVWFVHRMYLRVGAREFWTEACWRPLAAGAGLAAAALIMHGGIGSWAGLIAAAIVAPIVYAILVYWLIDDAAKALLAQWLESKFRRSR
jgi:O-antigen/teichoic acid export membrane protein